MVLYYSSSTKSASLVLRDKWTALQLSCTCSLQQLNSSVQLSYTGSSQRINSSDVLSFHTHIDIAQRYHVHIDNMR